jgi:hypothetical protein
MHYLCMDCNACREAISALLDDEDPGMDPTLVEAHGGPMSPGKRRGRAGCNRVATLLVATAAAVVLLAACSSTPSSSASTATRPATPARLEILAPSSGAVVGPQPTLRPKLSGPRLATAAASATRVPTDQGFVHVYVDDQLVSVLYSLTQKLPPLDAGAHTVRVEFVAVDHTPFANKVTDSTRFSVKVKP